MLNTLRRIVYRLWPATTVASAFACLLLLSSAQSASAQPPSCNDIITQLEGSLAPGICQAIGLGNACLATRSVTATPRTGTLRFSAPGNQAALTNIRRMITVPQKGAAVLLGGSAANPVKVLVFGDTATSPNATQSGRVFTLRAANGQPTCERTRSGMILQTPDGQNGTLVVNGVTINLGSTAYIVPGADLLFDQDPRIDRRQGSRNRNAPLCSGFDSDCGFGDDSCSEDDRLVYGPFCREDNYEYIAAGLYRVSLYGEGEVQAGATDYNISYDYEMMGTQRLSLPGSYTFCWNGLEEGGTGFETIVQARSSDAFVDHISVEYLGRDCGLAAADDPSAGMGTEEMGVLTVYNMQGNVGIELPDGQSNAPDAGQRMRVYYDEGQPVAMDDFPTDAPYILGSELAQWATTEEGLPSIRVTGTVTSTPARDPVVTVDAAVLYDDGSPSGLRIEAQAYDPAAGTENGDGIEYVYFEIRDQEGNLIFENDEETPAYCAFGGNSPCEVSLEVMGDSGGGFGVYQVTATAYAAGGRRASATARLVFDGGAPEVEPTVEPTVVPPYTGDTTPPFFNSISYPSGDYCYGETLQVGAEVYDDSGSIDVTFHYLLLYVDPEFPEYGGYPYESVYLGNWEGSYQGEIAVGDLNSASFYFSAVDAAGNASTSETITLTGRSCDPIVN